jgi:replicative DNA helicase
MESAKTSATVVAVRSEKADGVSYRTAPHNLDAEAQLLGAILVNNDAATRVMGFLQPGHFYEAVLGEIYDAALKLIERNQRATPVTLRPYFENHAALKDVGGAAFLARLAAEAATIIHAEDYGRQIYDLALRRELIQVGETMVLTAYDSPIEASAPQQIEQAEDSLFKLAETGQHEGGFQTFKKSLTTAIQSIESAYRRDSHLVGVTTGFRDLDNTLGGLHKSDLVILACRPGMGKTSLATNIAFNAAKARQRAIEDGVEPGVADGAVVGFFSLEMSSEQLAIRILSARSGISSHKLRQGQISREESHDVVRAAREIEELPLFIDDTPALSIAALRTRARRLYRQHNLSLIFVDYLQLLRSTNMRANDSRVQEVSQITQGLKALAKELNVPVVALSQLSRVVEQRDDKRPMLSDLRESGSIEQDADVVLFLFREEYYHRQRRPDDDSPSMAEWREKEERVHGRAEVMIAKQRHGPVGNVKMLFDSNTTNFSDYIASDHLPDEIP